MASRQDEAEGLMRVAVWSRLLWGTTLPAQRCPVAADVPSTPEKIENMVSFF
jgi:hypothetical protein